MKIKKLVICLIILCSPLLTSCLNDDNDNYIGFFYELVPIDSVEIPNQFVRGEIVEIAMFYLRPSPCHSFSNFNYDKVSKERTISIVNVFIDNGNSCDALLRYESIKETLEFRVGGGKIIYF